MNSYKLNCDFCNKMEFPSKRRIFEIRISEILDEPYVSKSGDKYPHKTVGLRYMQICEGCFKESKLQKCLNIKNRGIEL